ncbi:MAG: cytochrome c peroxidase [Phycisphaerales bacterium]
MPVPPENPITEEKRVLGKILFWDEQLSSNNTMACGTCHIPSAGGADPRVSRNPGIDLTFNTPDDVFGSRGVPRTTAAGEYEVDASFGTGVQVTGRAANPNINAAYFAELFWDGRATSEFRDPVTDAVIIPAGGALESQAVGPPLSSVEMAHPDRDWAAISTKLESARPLALATNIPADMQAAIDADPDYPALFAAAFGDPEINPVRIAFALATYQRTLVSDQSPWDLYMLGDTGAMTPLQEQGWLAFQQSNCAVCHIPPLFTDGSFRNVGMRPNNQDTGRFGVTGDPNDMGRFKTPTLRNLGLRSTFMHTGHVQSMQLVLNLYRAPLNFANLDPLLPVTVPPPQEPAVIEFLLHGLTDPRVANEEFPFDRPTLRSELPRNPEIIGVGTPDPGTGITPRMVSHAPPLGGSGDFSLGVVDVPEGATVRLLVSDLPPVNGVLSPTEEVGPLTATAGAGAAPVATAFWPVPDDSLLDGTDIYFQWVVDASGARSHTARATIVCGTGGCTVVCPADVNGNGVLDPGDFTAWVSAYNNGDPAADQNNNGALDPGDFTAWVSNYNNGC